MPSRVGILVNEVVVHAKKTQYITVVLYYRNCTIAVTAKDIHDIIDQNIKARQKLI